MKKTFTLFLLAFFMMVSNVWAEDVVVNNIKLTLNFDAIHLTSKTTEGYVDAAINSDIIAVAEGEEGYSVNYGNTGLSYWGGNGWYGIGNGTGQVSKDKVYAIVFTIDMNNGYKAGELNDITLVVNGETVNMADRTERGNDLSGMKVVYSDYIRLFYVLPQANDDDVPVVVNHVSVTPVLTYVKKGLTKQFEATVNCSSSDSEVKAVTWSVTGNTSANTTISKTGLLTIGDDETAKQLTVKATSVTDNTKSAEVAVKVCSYEVQEVSLSLNIDEMPWTVDDTTAEAAAYFMDHISVSEDYLRIDKGNSFLIFMDGSWTYYGGIATEKLTKDRIYGCRVDVELNSSDYCWPQDVVTLAVKLNGEILTFGNKVIKDQNVLLENYMVGSEPYSLSVHFVLPDPRSNSSVQGIETESAETDNVYNLQGMKVKSGYHGIVVKRGKKYVAR